MRRILHIARMEYLAYVRTKTFLVSVILLPFILMLAFGLPSLMHSLPKPPRAFTLVDHTGGDGAERLLEEVRGQLAGPQGIIQIEMSDYAPRPAGELDLPADPTEQHRVLREKALAGELAAYFVLTAQPGKRMPQLDYYAVDATADDFRRIVHRVLDHSLTREYLAPFVADSAALAEAVAGLPVKVHTIAKEEGLGMAGHVARGLAPMAFVYLLWISVMTMSSHLMTSTVEEKSSRIMEIVLSSVSPQEFLTGKLVGLGAAGITTIASWVLTGVLLSFVIPSTGVRDVLAGLGSAFTPWAILAFLMFFLLGFLFYSAIYVGLGSVCNTMREAQNLMQPIMIVFIIPLFLMWFVTKNPNHIVAVLASFFPPFTPFLMMNRIPANPAPPVWQILGAAAVMILATWGTIAAAAKVFRIGILMYGKPPTLPEILRWARQRG